MKNRHVGRVCSLVTLGTFALTSTAQGAITVYTDRASFNAAAGSLGTIVTEGYENDPVNVGPGPGTISLAGFDISYDLSGGSSWFGVNDNNNANAGLGITSTAGFQFFSAEYFGTSPPTTTTFLFDAPIHAFATDVRDVEDHFLNFTTSEGSTGTAAVAMPSGEIQFFGVLTTDEPFISIGFTLLSGGGGDTVVFDETSYVVPAPAAALPLVTGGLMAACRRRRTA